MSAVLADSEYGSSLLLNKRFVNSLASFLWYNPLEAPLLIHHERKGTCLVVAQS
jgi:hypothetical protein